MTRHVGILTSGGDCPGLNAAIRGFGKAAIQDFGMELLGFRDGFRGLVQDRSERLEAARLSGILTDGGTLLGTSRDKPHKMPVGGKVRDMTDAAVETYRRHRLDCLVCLGGGGTQKNALRLARAGLNVVTLPKTIDNDVAGTDISFGFDTSMQIATEAIDRLHSTATSHRRIIVVEIMGHRAGWLALGAGLTILGHLLRGGTPSAFDRVLSTRLGTAAAELVAAGTTGVMAAVRGEEIVPVPLEDVAGRKKLVPAEHPWVRSARLVGTSFGD